MSLEFFCENIEEVSLAAKEISSRIVENIVLLDAEMGSGKTTITKMILTHLGCKDNIKSPTFSIVNEYLLGNKKVFHLDLYRLKNIHEFYEIGGEEYLFSNDLCFIEWPNIIYSILDQGHHTLKIEKTKNDYRKINFN